MVTCSEVIGTVNEKATKYEVNQLENISQCNDKPINEKIFKKTNFLSLFPWFIVVFVLLALINSFGLIPQNISSYAKNISKFLMVCALAAIGMNTSFKDLKKSGIKPMIHGFIISLLVVIVAIFVEWCMGIV